MSAAGEWRLAALAPGEVERIHAESLRLLREIGLRVHDAPARQRLKRAGAVVEESGTVRLTEALVAQALETAPAEIQLCQASGRAMPCGPGRHYMGTQGYVPHFWDFETQAHYSPGERETARWARLADALPAVQIVQPITQATTMPAKESAVRMARATALNTTKHFLAQPLDLFEAEVWFELSQIVAQGDEARRKGLVTFMASSNSPLQLDAKNAALIGYAAEREIPLAFFSGPLAGATSPVTLAGTLVLQNAETLFGLALNQAVRPGAPFILGMASGSLDLRTGSASYGSVEYSLMKIATGQLARFYNLPFFSALATTDSAGPDAQSGIEKATSLLLTLLSGVHFTSGAGGLATATAAAYEQLVIDHEIYQMAERLLAGIEVSDDRLAGEAIRRAGIGGHFLEDEHTRAWMRSGEHFFPEAANREGPGGADMLARAHEIATRALAEHTPAVPAPVAEAIEAYVERRLADLKRA